MNDILLHSGIIEFLILIIIVLIYYSKLIPKEHMTICLLGTYILIKSVSLFGHSLFHN
jgi:hypothetical protein